MTETKTTTATGAETPREQNHTPFRRWFREVGWRHVVGAVALVFAAFPILYVLSASLNPLGTVASTSLIPTRFSLINYQTLLSGSKGPFTRWYLNTMIVCGVVAAAQIFFSVLAAYAFSRFRFKGRRGGLLALLLIMMFPATLAMIAIYTMIAGIGDVLPAIGLNRLLGYCLALMGGALGQVWLIKGTFDTIPKELDEAAILDGCTHWQVFYRILLPSLKPILATTFLLAFVGIISEFMLGSIFLTDDSKKTLAVGLYGMLSGDRSNNLGIFAAGSVMTMVPVIALFQYLQKYIVGGATAGAVKG
ncbi:carbohydrate ABC transporter membrane protein 2, CUT1 family [Actinomyces ruminicola]|uniref:Carbohydrate ABC transporter membrane protein 2, CUT1 family n=1 Tax=Actinomyces ruminicola TaxID=332524 RepID=A0A1H0CCQ8_9ACTO|nr:sugar ABC transporter permease [Actinomyces ruminicola]SDN55665.1 carbohydrate ABC transporter membrane protein 2, CUT1 family [Actinomyces ruminicola]